MLYLCVCSVAPICGLHCQVVEGTLFSIQRLGNNDGTHSFLYIEHTVGVPTCSRRGGRSDGRRRCTQCQYNNLHYDTHTHTHTHTQFQTFNHVQKCPVMCICLYTVSYGTKQLQHMAGDTLTHTHTHTHTDIFTPRTARRSQQHYEA